MGGRLANRRNRTLRADAIADAYLTRGVRQGTGAMRREPIYRGIPSKGRARCRSGERAAGRMLRYYPNPANSTTRRAPQSDGLGSVRIILGAKAMSAGIDAFALWLKALSIRIA